MGEEDMKIAITADIHLTTSERHPERYHALENILDQMVEQDINTLIIAGDLFDATCTTPGEFEDIVKRKKYSKIKLFIIPGNHDPVISDGTFSLQNVEYISKPRLIKIDDSIPFIFIPYTHGSSIGEALATSQLPLDDRPWVLVGHGDWLSSTAQKNQYEGGTYMPLSGRDLLIYKPKKVFLGHIHAQTDTSTIHYAGSPCAVDPTETGSRTFLIFDTKTWKTSRSVVNTDYLFFNEQFIILPIDDEETYIKTLLTSRIKAWNISPDHKKKVRVRLKARGYSSDRNRLVKVLRELMEEYQFADNDQPDISQVKISIDTVQDKIAELVKQKIDLSDLPQGPHEPDRDDIILAAMSTIYRGK